MNVSKASPIALTASKGLENERRRKNTHLKSATFSLNDHDNVVQTLLSSSASPIILTLEPTHQKPTTLTFYPLPHFLLCGLHVDVKKKTAEVPGVATILPTPSTPTAAAAFFKWNTFRAAPVLVSEDVLQTSGG